MKIIETISINVKKLKARTGKALFLIIPIAVLVGLSFVISSQVKNIQQAMDENIFSEIEDEFTVLEVHYQVDTSERGFGFMQSENVFTEADLEKIASLDGVADASINSNVPISNISTDDLFEGISLNVRQLGALNENMAGVYTGDTFSYVEGKPIPIVLNASTFMESYEDWDGKDEYTVDFSEMRGRPEPGENPGEPGENGPMQSTPMKTRAIEYDANELIGKEFTLTFGGFEDVNSVETEMADGVVTFRKMTSDEIVASEAERKQEIDQYWDYDSLSKGITYSFIVVGIIEDDNEMMSYVPEDFANALMNEYVTLQLDSEVADVPSDLLSSTFTGLTFDGLELSSGRFGGMVVSGRMGGGMGFSMGGPPGGDQEDGASYAIPGLVIEIADDNSSDVVGIYDDHAVFENAVKTGDVIQVKLNSVADREKVVDELNDEGYAYQDTGDLEVLYNVQSTLKKISSWLIVGFIGLTVAVIILTMSKFVSDSRKEIGIFRAVGFTKGNILAIFLFQAVLYTLVGYVIGVVLGTVLNLAISPVIAGWFENFVTETVSETFNVVGSVDKGIFATLDIYSVGLLSGILFVVSIFVSFFPAYTASNVSPVEAIRNE